MKTKTMYITNSHFNVRANERQGIIVITLVGSVIPAEKWNQLRNNICNDTKISDDVMVYFDYLIINGEVDRFSYVKVGDWRRLGFSGNNIKNCIPAAPKEVIEEANKWFYYHNETLNNGVLCGRTLERIKQTIYKQIFATEMRTLAEIYRKNFKEVGMTDEDVNNWFEQTIQDVYHPKC